MAKNKKLIDIKKKEFTDDFNIEFSSDEGSPNQSVGQKRKVKNLSHTFGSNTFLKEDARRSVIGNRGVSQNKFKTEVR